MKTLATAMLALALTALALPLAAPSAEGTTTAMRFGMDAPSIGAQTNAGVKPDYGTIWVGPWTLTSGWGGPDGELAAMKRAGVTPAIHFYYWGDDIAQACFGSGCWSSLHNAWKDKAGWNRLTDQLVSHLWSQMGGSPVLVFVETEFNKGSVQGFETLDGELAAKAQRIRTGYPAARTVMALGNWNSADWPTWDRFAAASDFTGLQGMRGSTRDSASSYAALYDATLSGARTLQGLFRKPIILQDIALSSYPAPDYVQRQADSLGRFFSGLGALQSAGVQAILYRSWLDSPNMDTANYYGIAERHWGLASSGGWKPSAKVWVDGVKAARGGAATATTSTSASTTTSTSTGTYAATFAVASGSNEWWVETKVTASPAPVRVEVSEAGGPWQSLTKRSWGSWAASHHVPKGTPVVLRAVASDGRAAHSESFAWLGAPTSTTATGTATTFSATFQARSVGNDWWVETAVTQSSQSVAKVEAKVDGGAWTALPKTSWGTYAKSLHAPNGAKVSFRATSTSGAIATGPTATWW